MEFLRRSAEALTGICSGSASARHTCPPCSRGLVGVVPRRGRIVRRSIAIGEEGVRIAETVNHPFSRIGAYWGIGSVYLRKGDFHQAILLLEHGLGLSQVVHSPDWFTVIASALSLAYALSGRIAEALRLLEQAVAQGAMRSHGSPRSGTPLSAKRTCWPVAWRRRVHRPGKPSRSPVPTRNEAARRGPCGCSATSPRMMRPQVEIAEAHYQQALALVLAEELGMRPLLAHCHLGLGTLYLTRARRDRPALPCPPPSPYTAPWRCISGSPQEKPH